MISGSMSAGIFKSLMFNIYVHMSDMSIWLPSLPGSWFCASGRRFHMMATETCLQSFSGLLHCHVALLALLYMIVLLASGRYDVYLRGFWT